MDRFNWKNKNGTSDRSCNCGSWKNHWTRFSNKEWPDICRIDGCNNRAEVGAHIIGGGSRLEYIIPACRACNNRVDVFNIKSIGDLVIANKRITCGSTVIRSSVTTE